MNDGLREFIEEILKSLESSWQNFVNDLKVQAEIWIEEIKKFFSKKEPVAPSKRVPLEWLKALEKFLAELDQIVPIREIPREVLTCATIRVWVLLRDFHTAHTSKGKTKSPFAVETVLEQLFRSALQQCAEMV